VFGRDAGANQTSQIQQCYLAGIHGASPLCCTEASKI
jgi:hypothetical protein